MDNQHRAGEELTLPFRSDRFFYVDNKWYFTTREGFDSGPFASRQRAEAGVKRFLHIVSLLPKARTLH